MDKASLVASDLDAGRKIIKRLEDSGIAVDTALWLQDDDSGMWRLVIASPDVNRRGPRHVYSELARFLREMKNTDIRLEDVGVVGTGQRLIRDLKNRVRTNDGLHEISLDGLDLGGVRFSSSRIYRATGRGALENGARIRIKGTDQLGTVRGVVDGPRGQRYLVVYDLDPTQGDPLDGTLRGPSGRDYAAEDLEFLYVVRTGGWPEELPDWLLDMMEGRSAALVPGK